MNGTTTEASNDFLRRVTRKMKLHEQRNSFIYDGNDHWERSSRENASIT